MDPLPTAGEGTKELPCPQRGTQLLVQEEESGSEGKPDGELQKTPMIPSTRDSAIPWQTK